MSDWDDLKVSPGVWGYSEDGKEYRVYRDDGNRRSRASFDKLEYATAGTDCKDFYDTVKPLVDAGTELIQPRADDGLPHTYPSPRPVGLTTYFSGSGDNGGIANGNELLFSLADTDASQEVDLSYNETVYIKDWFMICRGAPFGSYIDVEIVHPTAGVVGSFCKKVFLLDSFPIPLNTEDRCCIEVGLKVRVTVYNSDGTGIKEPKAAFTGVSRIEMYRVTTV